ncbi:MAG: hypothetical protein WCL08_07555 [Verrucomicrobiota bacterium]
MAHKFRRIDQIPNGNTPAVPEQNAPHFAYLNARASAMHNPSSGREGAGTNVARSSAPSFVGNVNVV